MKLQMNMSSHVVLLFSARLSNHRLAEHSRANCRVAAVGTVAASNQIAILQSKNRKDSTIPNSLAKQNFNKQDVIQEDFLQQKQLLPENLSIKRYIIKGSQRASNYWWALVISLGGLAFLMTGFAAFLNTSFFNLNQATNISFFPQGLIMCFYGSLGLLFGVYLWCTIFWGVGNGFNEFNKKEGKIRIFRWGLPGKDRRIDLLYNIEQVLALRVEFKDGINPRRTISLKLKSMKKENPSRDIGGVDGEAANQLIRKQETSPNGTIPITNNAKLMRLEEIESEASELAQFLQVPIDSFYEM